MMDISKAGKPTEYTFVDGKQTEKVDPSRKDVAKKIDANEDGRLDTREIRDYMVKERILREDKAVRVNESRVNKEFKAFLKNEKLEDTKGYHTYDQIASELKSLEKKYPELAQVVSLGKTHEGRDIWAIKLSEGIKQDTTSKPGVVFTGATHAREWASMEVPLALAGKLLDGYGKDEAMTGRLKGAEVWIVPVANPDGYEYSRTKYSMWRKNRNPITNTGCPRNAEGNIACKTSAETSASTPVGVDLNRNYWDGDPKHIELYRPAGDKPCDTSDDFSATSDDPDDDTYRGPSGASESEVKAVINLEKHPNIKGVIDHHGYGGLILYPPGYTYDEAPNAALYKEIGKGMAKAMSNPYTVEQSSELYPTSGSSDDCADAMGRLAFTIELGRSFQPSESQLPNIIKDVNAADLYFLDWIAGHKDTQA